MSFLKVEIICVPGKFTTYVYHKTTFEGIDIHFDSF